MAFVIAEIRTFAFGQSCVNIGSCCSISRHVKVYPRRSVSTPAATLAVIAKYRLAVSRKIFSIIALAQVEKIFTKHYFRITH